MNPPWPDRALKRLKAIAEAPPSDVPTVPQTVGKYRILREIGRGTAGIVYEAENPDLRHRVALKVLKAQIPEEGSCSYERFVREAQVSAEISHPNVVSVHDAGRTSEKAYLAMDLVEGGTFREFLHQGRQSLPERVRILEMACRGVAAAHAKGVVHRDLKPENILIASDGAPKVSDFGLARSLGESSTLTQAGVQVGTPSYMAPEQVRGEPEEIGPRTDVYALGAILYEILIGVPPHTAATLQELYAKILTQEPPSMRERFPDTPPELEAIAGKALQKQASLRYADAGELADDLRRYLNLEPIAAVPADRGAHVSGFLRRHPAVGAGLFLLLAALGAAGWIWGRASSRRPSARETAPVPRNLILNPSFENGLASWDADEYRGMKRTAWVDDRPYSGRGCVRLEVSNRIYGATPGPHRWLGFEQLVPATPGQTYRLVARFRVQGRRGLVIPTLNAAEVEDDRPQDVPVSDQWTPVSRLIRATKEKVLVGVGARVGTDEYDAFIFVDDFQLVEVAGPAEGAAPSNP